MTTNTVAPAVGEFRCYVADLAAYNHGHLIGEWIALDGLSADEIREEVAGVIRRSPFEGAEEYAIHDWDGLPATFGEWPDWDAVAAYVEAMGSFAEEDEAEAFRTYCENIGCPVNTDSLEQFRESYCGLYDSGADYAEETAYALGVKNDQCEWPFTCIDWEAAWRELELGGDNWSHRGSRGLHVFRNI